MQIPLKTPLLPGLAAILYIESQMWGHRFPACVRHVTRHCSQSWVSYVGIIMPRSCDRYSVILWPGHCLPVPLYCHPVTRTLSSCDRYSVILWPVHCFPVPLYCHAVTRTMFSCSIILLCCDQDTVFLCRYTVILWPGHRLPVPLYCHHMTRTPSSCAVILSSCDQTLSSCLLRTDEISSGQNHALQIIKRTPDPLDTLIRHMRVNLRCLTALVP